ncbi:hypothetical protein GCM10007937_58290 [Mesorhizobium albiziae]|nr:hypothetical protein GCM10007937_58290 [Mesorhizobium albiziae]
MNDSSFYKVPYMLFFRLTALAIDYSAAFSALLCCSDLPFSSNFSQAVVRVKFSLRIIVIC